jgi:hypothetical protein
MQYEKPRLAANQPAFYQRPMGLMVIIGAWLLIVVSGVSALARHAAIPGPVIHPDMVWPAGDSVPRTAGIATLVMTVHPECPCTRASVNELEVLMTHCHGRLNATVLFVELTGFHEDSAARELWQSAAGIAGVACRVDRDGELAARFGAITSGQVFLYDASGVLKFNGGITASRGHAGDNDGVDAIEAIVNHTIPATRQTPVFGCSLR